MRKPQSPPNLGRPAADFRANPDQFEQALQAVSGPLHRGRYVHWDKLRHLAPPQGLRTEQWWLVLKLHRRSLLKPLHLTDAGGRPFQYGLPDPALELLHGLDRDAAGQILVSDRAPTPQMRDRYIIRSLMEEAITSSQIEGAATTRVVAKTMLRTGRKPRNRDEQMISNNYAAMQRIRTLKDQPLTREIILDLHHILTEQTMNADTVGRFRHSDERVVVEDQYHEIMHVPPPAEQLPQRTQAMLDFANGLTPDHFLHPVVRAIILHFWLAYDHPFVDGNGRCARALFYWSMLRSGYWLSEFISISPLIRKTYSQYARAFLYTETDDNDVTYFVLYHLELIRRAIDALKEDLAEKMREIREAEQLLRDSDLNYRQLALLAHGLRHPEASYTVASHQRSHNIAYETARKDLFDLVRRGLLEVRKRGRTYQFRPVPDLSDRVTAVEVSG